MKLATAIHSRRKTIKIIGYSSLISVLPVGMAGCNWNQVSLEAIAERMISLLFYSKKAQKIGALYIAEAPELQGQTAEQLTERILDRLQLSQSEVSHEDMALIETKIKKTVHQDFMNDDFVILRGWMVSRTEITLCALASVFYS